MSKWKEFVERSKREYAEASPEGKRKIKQAYGWIALLLLALLFGVAMLFVSNGWRLLFMIIFAALCIPIFTDAL